MYVYDSHCHSSDAFNVYTFNTSLCAFTTFVFLEDGEKGRYNVIFKMTCHTTRLKNTLQWQRFSKKLILK